MGTSLEDNTHRDSTHSIGTLFGSNFVAGLGDGTPLRRDGTHYGAHGVGMALHDHLHWCHSRGAPSGDSIQDSTIWVLVPNEDSTHEDGTHGVGMESILLLGHSAVPIDHQSSENLVSLSCGLDVHLCLNAWVQSVWYPVH